jgi:hypothetical protein
MTATNVLCISLVGLMASCASMPVETPQANVPAIESVYLEPFTGGFGKEFTQEIRRQLGAMGIALAAKEESADATLGGSVIDYRPNQKLMIFLGTTQTVNSLGEAAMLTNPIVSTGGSQALQQNTNTQIVTTQASLGIMARMVDRRSGKPVWSAQILYEGFDAQSVSRSVAESLARSIQTKLSNPS